MPDKTSCCGVCRKNRMRGGCDCICHRDEVDKKQLPWSDEASDPIDDIKKLADEVKRHGYSTRRITGDKRDMTLHGSGHAADLSWDPDRLTAGTISADDLTSAVGSTSSYLKSWASDGTAIGSPVAGGGVSSSSGMMSTSPPFAAPAPPPAPGPSPGITKGPIFPGHVGPELGPIEVLVNGKKIPCKSVHIERRADDGKHVVDLEMSSEAAKHFGNIEKEALVRTLMAEVDAKELALDAIGDVLMEVLADVTAEVHLSQRDIALRLVARIDMLEQKGIVAPGDFMPETAPPASDGDTWVLAG